MDCGHENCDENIDAFAIAADLGLDPNDPESFLSIALARRTHPLARVSDAHYVGWNCKGEVAIVLERRGNGRFVEMGLRQFRDRYNYSALRMLNNAS